VRTKVGIAGLLYRPTIHETDVGYSLLPEHYGKGYATEVALAVLDWGRRKVGLTRITALVSSRNAASIRVATKIGLKFEKQIQLYPDTPFTDLYS
jgi:[ribosomal protein S5]-alanine N-acetyltransferase